MKDKKDIYWRAYLIYFGFVVIMLVVLSKTIAIQFEGSSNLLSSDGKIPVRKAERIPRRGEILDANYTPLVTTITFYDVHMDPTVVDQKIFDAEINELARGLARMYPNKSALEYENYIRRGRERKSRFLTIRKKITNEERKALRTLPIFNLGRLKGGIIDTDQKLIRKNTHGAMLRRTIGYYLNTDGQELKVGIEGAFNDYLSGEPGEEIEQKITTGWKKTGQIVKESVEGADVILSIDKEIQEVAESELERQLKNQGAKSGCVVVMDVKTGFVKAIANLTATEDKKEYTEQFNYAVGHREVPGSTMKLASLMAALEDEKIKITDMVNAFGEYQFAGRSLTDAHKGGYGRITIKQAFEKSSNVIAQIINRAYREEPEAFLARLDEFCLTRPLGIDLPGEVSPNFHRPGMEGWSALSLPWMSIGYEFQQTPLQTLAFYNAVANNGTFVRPQFVKEIKRGSQLVKKFEPIVLNKKICSDETLRDLQSCLEGVMKKGGTGAKLTSSQFTIAGKTGTAHILNENNEYGAKGQKTYQASFVGYFPSKNPIYSCIVVVSAPSKDVYGAIVSGTVFAAVANKVYASHPKYHKAINIGAVKKTDPPRSMAGNRYDLIKIFKKLGLSYSVKADGEWLTAKADSTKIELKNRTVDKKSIPNVIGLSAKDAVYLIESAGMSAHLRGFGKVVAQSIPSGRPIFRGGVIELMLK